MTAAQLIKAATQKYADAIPKPQLTTSNPSGGISATTPKPPSPGGGINPIKPMGLPGAGGGTAPLAKPMVSGVNPLAGAHPTVPPASPTPPTPPTPNQQNWPNWVKPEYQNGQHRYFPNEQMPGGRVVNVETGVITQAHIPDREAWLQGKLNPGQQAPTPQPTSAAPPTAATTPQAAPPPAQPTPPAAAPTTPVLTTQGPTMGTPAQPAAPTDPQMTQTGPQTIVSNTQGTMTDVNGQPVATEQPKPSGPEAFIDALKARSAGKEPTGGVIDMTKPLDVGAVSGHFNNPNLKPEQKTQLATDLTKKLMQENPQYYEGFQDMQAGKKDTPAAMAYQQRLSQAQDEFVKQQVQADPQKAATPQGFGDIVNNAMSTFQNMPMPLQAMVGIGLPVGLIGVMSGLFGEGGMGMGILGALGLGAGMLGGAAGGLFGQGAQNMTADAAYQVGSFLGMAPEARKGSLDALRGEDAIKRMTAGPSQADQEAAFKDPTGHAKKVQQQLDQAGQVRQLMNLPEGMRPQFLRNIDPSLSEEDAVIAARNAAEFATQMDTKDSPVAQMMQQGRDFVANPHGTVNQKADEHVRGKLPWGTQWAAPYIRSGYQWANGIPSAPAEKETRGCDMTFKQSVEKWAFNDMDAKELSDLEAWQMRTKKYDADKVRRLYELQKRQVADMPKENVVDLTMKSARCWAGYEPVPGKKPFSEDSCRPVGSGKKKSQPKKKSDK